MTNKLEDILNLTNVKEALKEGIKSAARKLYPALQHLPQWQKLEELTDNDLIIDTQLTQKKCQQIETQNMKEKQNNTNCENNSDEIINHSNHSNDNKLNEDVTDIKKPQNEHNFTKTKMMEEERKEEHANTMHQSELQVISMDKVNCSNDSNNNSNKDTNLNQIPQTNSDYINNNMLGFEKQDANLSNSFNDTKQLNSNHHSVVENQTKPENGCNLNRYKPLKRRKKSQSKSLSPLKNKSDSLEMKSVRDTQETQQPQQRQQFSSNYISNHKNDNENNIKTEIHGVSNSFSNSNKNSIKKSPKKRNFSDFQSFGRTSSRRAPPCSRRCRESGCRPFRTSSDPSWRPSARCPAAW